MNLVVADATLGNDSVLATALFDLLKNTRELEYMAHQFHWNIVGVKFNTMHEFYEEEYKQLFEDQDEIAEQIRQQGFFVPVINNVLLEENYSASGFEEQLIVYSGKLTQNITLIDKVNDLAKNEIAVQDLCARLKGLRGLSLNLKVKAMLGANKMSLEPSEANVVESAAKETPLLERILHSWASKKGYKVNKWNHGMNIQFDILPSNFNQTTDKEYENAVIFVIQIDEKDRVARVKTNSFGDSLCNLNLDAIGTASTRKLNSIFDSFIPVTDYWGCLVYKPYPTFRKIQTDRKIAKETASAVTAVNDEELKSPEYKTFVEVAKDLGLKKGNFIADYDGFYKGRDVSIEFTSGKTARVELYPLSTFNVELSNRSKDSIKKEILDKFDECISREKVTASAVTAAGSVLSCLMRRNGFKPDDSGWCLPNKHVCISGDKCYNIALVMNDDDDNIYQGLTFMDVKKFIGDNINELKQFDNNPTTALQKKLSNKVSKLEYKAFSEAKVTAGFDKGRYKEINKESDFFKMLRNDCGIRNKNFYTINKGLRLALNIIKGTFEEASIRYFLLKNVGGYIRVELNDKVYIVGYTIYDTGKIKVWTKELKSAVPVNSFDYSMLNSYAKIGTKLVRGMLPTWLSV